MTEEQKALLVLLARVVESLERSGLAVDLTSLREDKTIVDALHGLAKAWYNRGYDEAKQGVPKGLNLEGFEN